MLIGLSIQKHRTSEGLFYIDKNKLKDTKLFITSIFVTTLLTEAEYSIGYASLF